MEYQHNFLESLSRIPEFERFLRYERQLAEGTIDNYIRTIKELKIFVNKDLLLASEDDIRGFLKLLNQKQMGKAGICNYITGLRSYFNWLAYITKDKNMIELNFFVSKIIKAKRDITIPVVMPTLEEIMKLRKVMQSYKEAVSFAIQSDTYKTTLREIAAIELLITTGMRNKELRALRFSDVDIAENFLFIRKGKGNTQRMSIFGYSAQKALKEYFTSQTFEENDLIFPYKQGNILNYIVKRWARRAGINEKLHAHSFRHFYVTETLGRGGDLQAVGNQVGHRNLNTTNYYTHINAVILKKRLSEIAI